MACQFFAGFAFPRSAVVLQPNERQQMGKTADCRFLIYTLAVAYFLSGAGFYQIYCTLQMLIIALAVLNLKEQAQAQAV